jgi:Signal recognition particle 14kD protein
LSQADCKLIIVVTHSTSFTSESPEPEASEQDTSHPLSTVSNLKSIFPSIKLHSSEESSKPRATLFRATNGKSDKKKAKLATVVEANDLDGFLEKYAEICRAGMGDGLKKRDRKKKERKRKAKAKRAAAKEKETSQSK